jgi:hypothetical protein
MEAAGRGMSEVIRARGEAAEHYARARLSHEEARRRYIDNQRAWHQAYLERKRANIAFRQERYARERKARDRYLATRRESPPPRLSPDQLDPETGYVVWPEALLGDEFAEQRQRVEELLVLRAHIRYVSGLADEIHAIAREMQDELRGRIREIPGDQYLAARRFLDALAWEGRVGIG